MFVIQNLENDNDDACSDSPSNHNEHTFKEIYNIRDGIATLFKFHASTEEGQKQLLVDGDSNTGVFQLILRNF